MAVVLTEALRQPHELFRLRALAIVHHALGRVAESNAALQELIDKNAQVGAYQVADVTPPAARWTRHSNGSNGPMRSGSRGSSR